MRKNTIALTVVMSFTVFGCASQTGRYPVVDTYNNPNAYRLNQDMQQCQDLASQASGGVARETAIGAGVGGLIGAAGGAALGAIMGDPGKGAAIGAVVGGVGGAAKQGLQSDDVYQNAYNSCLRQRGHTVVR